MDQRVKFFITICVCIAVLALFFFATREITNLTGHAITGSSIGELGNQSIGSENNALAKCLTEKGAKMYGAYWCPHCNDQKTEFGSAFQYITYVECDPQGQNANPQACSDAGVGGYPTWVIDGKKYEGAQSLDNLKSLAGC